MLEPTEIKMPLDEALELLRKYSCSQPKLAETPLDKEQLRQALAVVLSLSEWENLGICADNLEQGLSTLLSYLKGLGYPTNFEIKSQEDPQHPLYIKYNTQKQSYYVDSYTGSYRGVLISCQGEDETVVGTYGHFPLDLFK